MRQITMEKEWIIRKGRKDEFKKIAAFRARFPDAPIVCCNPKYYWWKCVDNPVHEGDIWLAESSRGEIVAIKSITPKKIKFLDKIIEGGEQGDSFTHPEYRRQGIFTALTKTVQRIALERGMSFIYNTPGLNSRVGYEKKLEYAVISKLKVYNLVRPLNVRRVLDVKYNHPLFSAVLAPVLEVISGINLKVMATLVDNSHTFISQVSSFPDDIQDLWHKASANYDIMLIRDKKYLEWRFFSTIDDYLFLIARDQEKKILGYIVGKIYIDKFLRRGYIAGFLTLEDQHRVFDRLLIALLELFRQNKVDIVSTWAIKGSLYYKTFCKFGFLPTARIPVLICKNKLGKQIIAEDYKWHFTMADSDNV